jgi:hypothetical protein
MQRNHLLRQASLGIYFSAREEVSKMRTHWMLVLVVSLALAVPVMAHHSFSAEFDGSKTIVLKGVLAQVEWTNPHILIYLDAKGSDGKLQRYTFSSGPPNMLHRAGIRKSDFKIGETVTITGAPSKDGTELLGWMKMIKYPDGHVFVYRNGAE